MGDSTECGAYAATAAILRFCPILSVERRTYLHFTEIVPNKYSTQETKMRIEKPDSDCSDIATRYGNGVGITKADDGNTNDINSFKIVCFPLVLFSAALPLHCQ